MVMQVTFSSMLRAARGRLAGDRTGDLAGDRAMTGMLMSADDINVGRWRVG